MSKKEARAARKLRKIAERDANSARLKTEPIAREVRIGANPGSIFQMQMSWAADEADRDGAWSWGVARDWGDDVWGANLLPKLTEFAKLTWAEIEGQTHGNEGKRHRSHHSMSTDAVCEEAQDRLASLEQYADILFRFRLGNLPRLWGIRVVEKFKILWYDPSHRVYPVE